MGKTIGIAVDNYKIEKFKKALAKAGFNEAEIVPFVGKTSLLRVLNVPADRVIDIHRICMKLQIDFGWSN